MAVARKSLNRTELYDEAIPQRSQADRHFQNEPHMINKQPQQPAKKNGPIRDKACYFCKNMYHEVDYKDATLLRRFMSSYGKIAPRRRSGVCSKHQRKLATAIKYARLMALVPFTRR